ncbi:TrpB-like pyridoxal phosphate-dependent enzyme [Conexibacter woesei]|uniref:Tryptophan synthase beta chain n=1 Tax=Conexibacter woesei (strain DSM 14684 / CCUG 47730 / CIP 108061 / JCM 11494 / NBRC 100937 / ID131577) TaxID=469383 RepID=D3FDJ6_CONWI|nr:TrpB-like pyridoxal phosphate-dependent enzyme [Conexibacter woesei]ADB49570.1 pyridoxal-phosphate dependent TrpB-like enzyme [Conexibacter woesei DSM 14684]
MSAASTTFPLQERDIPTHWVNLVPDLPEPPLPPLHPGTLEPAGPDDLAAIFPPAIIAQEVSGEPDVELPEQVREAYKLWRPTPLFRARRLERALDTPAHIYVKYEGVSPAGSHKPNSAVAQAYENAQAGVRKLTTETGAGQWGSSLAFACSLFGLECEVWMVGSSYDQKPYRRSMMQTWGASVHRSPSQLTDAGRAQAAHASGSLGIAISEAVEVAARDPAANYSLGSVLNHVCLHQTVIGQEAIAQLELAGEAPDVVVGCVGGGSNFAGLAFPFIRRVLRDGARTRFLAAEPAACPTLTRGAYRYDFGDTVGLTPLMPMYTLGHDFVPPPVHSGGLRYHGDSPLVSALVRAGIVEARAFRQNDAFAAALQFARTEGIVPGPEPAHAIRATVEEALAAREAGEPRVILLGLSGHGHFDLSAYDAYLAGELEDPEFSEADMDAALARLPQAPAIG